MKIKLLRHATMIIEYGWMNILTDPMLASAGAANPIPAKKAGKDKRNPLVELPIHAAALRALLGTIDAILITHMHFDHFDGHAKKILPKHVPVLCQSVDEIQIQKSGFTNLLPVEDHLQMQDISIYRTGGHHGGPLLRRKMGPVSGFVLGHADEPSLYICGDTIWCPAVRDALSRYKPEVVVAYAGAAQYPFGRSITMNARDITHITKVSDASIVAVHMGALNHCLLGRKDLADWAEKQGVSDRLHIPGDGEVLYF